MDTLISVIVPVYNTAPYLDRCISSIQKNSYQNLEIICVNDGSSDNSLEILQSLAAKDPRIIIIDKANAGVAEARNSGIAAAHGEWISFVDSDDWLHQDFFQTLYRLVEDADMVISDYIECSAFDEAERTAVIPANFEVQQVAADARITDSYVRPSPWAKLYRRSFISDTTFPAGLQYAEDSVFKVALQSKKSDVKLVVAHIPLYFYYTRPGSLVRSCPVDLMKTASEAFLALANELDRKDLALHHAFRMALIYRYYGLLSENKKGVRRNARKLLNKCKNMLYKEKRFSAKEKIALWVAASSAAIYRQSLIRSDKSYLEAEKRLKQERRNQSKN